MAYDRIAGLHERRIALVIGNNDYQTVTRRRGSLKPEARRNKTFSAEVFMRRETTQACVTLDRLTRKRN